MTDAALAPRPLEEALASLQARGLELRRGVAPPRGRPAPAARPVPTGHAALDDALRTAGWPRGALAGLEAPRGGGATTLALGTLAACQAEGGIVAWIDGEGSFDAATATHLGLDLEWCLVARPRDAPEAVELAAWLARSHLVDCLVLDAGRGGNPGSRALDRLAQLLARSGSVCLLLGALGGEAAVRVALRRLGWLAVGRDPVGQRVAAEVTRHRWALAGGRAELDLWFGEGRRVDPLLRGAACFEERHDQRPGLQILSA